MLWSQQVLKGGIVRAVVLNSGGANACTGPQGFQDTHATAEHTAAVLRGAAKPMLIGAGDVAVCSTGLIGELLPMDKLLPGVDAAAKALAADGGGKAAEAIMTTDTVPKNARRARATAGRSAGWPRAPACSPRRSPPCWSCSPPTRWPATTRWTRRCARRPG